MLKKFVPDDVKSQTQMKTSVLRNICKQLVDTYPTLAADLDILLPKKEAVYIAKCNNYINLVMSGGQVWFFQIRDGPYLPTLKVLHRYPDILPKVGIDKGGIKFVYKGANIMMPGLTSKGGMLPEDSIPAETYVAVMAEGKKHALAIGKTLVSTDEMKQTNSGIGIENIHCLDDGLWKLVNVAKKV